MRPPRTGTARAQRVSVMAIIIDEKVGDSGLFKNFLLTNHANRLMIMPTIELKNVIILIRKVMISIKFPKFQTVQPSKACFLVNSYISCIKDFVH
jgi:hypothetical protein